MRKLIDLAHQPMLLELFDSEYERVSEEEGKSVTFAIDDVKYQIMFVGECIGFRSVDRFEKRRAGHAAKVMNAIAVLAIEHVTKYSPPKIGFMWGSLSREKIYKALAQRMQTQISNLGYDMDQDQRGMYFTRKV